MLKHLFSEQRRLINSFFEKIDIEKTQDILDKILSCKGFIILSGVGKSGIIAKKIAMTFLSTGTKALFLPPMDALHGDIGIINENDICILFSKSGETKELISLLPYIRKKSAFLISVVSSASSQLTKSSDLFISLPIEKELCPFNLAPTVSTSVQLLFGDVLAVALMEKKQFSLEQYAQNHPSGNIGKKLTVQVKDLMIKGEDLPLCFQEDRIISILSELSTKRCGSLLIVDKEKRLKGIFTDGDLRRAIEIYGPSFLHKTVGELMTLKPLVVKKTTLAWEAMKKMEEKPDRLITVLPVTEEEKVIGLIRMHDMVQVGIKS